MADAETSEVEMTEEKPKVEPTASETKPQPKRDAKAATETETDAEPVVDAKALQAEIDKMRKALKERNAENEKNRKRLDEIDAAEKKKAEADMAEADLLKKHISERDTALAESKTQIESLQKNLQQTKIAHAVTLGAYALDFIDPEDALGLADLSEVTVDDDGKVEGVEKALKALAKAKPHLIEKATGGGTPPSNNGNPPRPNRPQPAATRPRFGGGI